MNLGVALTVVVALLAGCSSPRGGQDHTAKWISETSTYAGHGAAGSPPSTLASTDPIDAYAETAAKIITAARADRGAYTKLTELTDTIGNRLSGSPQLDQAIAWAVKTMKADGHATRTEKVMVPHWVRGPAEASFVSPIVRPLPILALGFSVGTPKAGITAEVVVVHSFDELEAKKATLKGKIVVYDVAMPAYTDAENVGYGEVLPYRGAGPSRAAKYGAVAALVRSLTAHSLRTLHTGRLGYADDQPKIPAAAITTEDAALLTRLAAKGPVKLRLAFDAKMLPDAPSANVIGELRGREKPDEIVVISAHLDSWDVGQGAHDDGAGCVMMMQTLTLLKQLGLTPRRTIRVVLFTNEENGLRGGTAYAKDHAAELPRHVFAFEADTGAFPPGSLLYTAKAELLPQAKARLSSIGKLLAPVGMHTVREDDGGADIGPMKEGGVILAGLLTDWKTYFDVHHSEADTLDKIDPAILADDVAAVAVLAYIVADMPDRLDAPLP